MNAERAYTIIKNRFPNHKVTGCIDYKKLYVFEVIPADADLKRDFVYIDPFYAVDKETGKIVDFHPLMDIDSFIASKRINVDSIRR